MDTVAKLVGRMEKAAEPILKLLPEYKAFQDLQKSLKLPSSTGGAEGGAKGDGVATQFSIGVNYWSGAHIDDDNFFTILSCLSNDDKVHDEIMYYFCYPEYNLAIPMRSGDVLIFNPLKKHCCSNCKFDDSYIFSAYVSTKTVMTKGIEKLMS